MISQMKKFSDNCKFNQFFNHWKETSLYTVQNLKTRLILNFLGKALMALPETKKAFQESKSKRFWAAIVLV